HREGIGALPRDRGRRTQGLVGGRRRPMIRSGFTGCADQHIPVSRSDLAGYKMWRQIVEHCREAAIVWLLEKWRRTWRYEFSGHVKGTANFAEPLTHAQELKMPSARTARLSCIGTWITSDQYTRVRGR